MSPLSLTHTLHTYLRALQISNAGIGLYVGGPSTVVDSVTVTDCLKGMYISEDGAGTSVIDGRFERNGDVEGNGGYGISLSYDMSRSCVCPLILFVKSARCERQCN